jgi:hypothetical protein
MSLATIQQVNEAIMFGNFTNEQISSIVLALKYARAQMSKQKARNFRAGDSVRFTSRGNVYFGSIERVKLKNAFVRVGNAGRYNVPLNMLETA